MRGVDTNVLLRYLAQDDPEHSRIASNLIEGAENDDERLYVTTIVLCELIWSLRSTYRVQRAGIVSILEELLSAAVFEIQERDLVRRAVEDFRQGPADFSDYLIGWQNRKAGCVDTVTFDRGLRAADGFSVLG